jgi:hypothetical protein
MCQANALEIKLSKIKIISLYFSLKVTYPERLDENPSDGISHSWAPLNIKSMIYARVLTSTVQCFKISKTPNGNACQLAYILE